MRPTRGSCRVGAGGRLGPLLAAMCLLASAACRQGEGTIPPEGTAAGPFPTTVLPAFDGPVFQPPAPAFAISASAEVPADRPLQAMVTVRATEPVLALARVSGPGVDGRVVEGEDEGAVVHIPLVALRERSPYAVDVVARTPDGRTAEASLTVTTGAIPDGLIPETTVLEDDGLPRPGMLITGTTRYVGGRPRLILWAVDAAAQPVWYYTDSSITGAPTAWIEPFGDQSLLVMLPDELRAIDAFGRSLWSIEHDPSMGGPFHHDAEVLPDGNVLVLSSEVRVLPVPPLGGEMNVVGDVILELDPSGDVVRSVALLDVLDPLRYPGRLSTLRLGGRGIDWSHANAVEYSAEQDAYLVSSRSQHWVVLIGRTTGEVEWILGEEGDFALEPGGEWFNAQHAPMWADGMIVVYDNGNEKLSPSGPYSRIAGYALDEGAWTARQDTEWILPSFTPAVGDVDDRGDAWLVTAGITLDGTSAFVYEVAKGGDVRWSVRYDTPLYRAEWVDALGVPAARVPR